MADDDSSELSSVLSLSPPPASEDELDEPQPVTQQKRGILKFFGKVDSNPALRAATKEQDMSPPPPSRAKREPSPPHETTLADNPDIAFIVMFRARFNDVFPKSLANFGPQELERDIVASTPGDRVENFLCALLGLLLNRKQDVKVGHYNRAVEEAIQTHKGQWPRDWNDQSLLAGSTTFASMTPVSRLSLLRALILWSLSSSEAIKTMINQNYKSRNEDDKHVGLSVQPWGGDGDKRRYFLVEGRDETAFRVYREGNPQALSQRTWWSVAGSLDELKRLAERLENQDGGPRARQLAKRMLDSIPRFESGEEKRRRREYRQAQRQRFRKPVENGLSLYEGRTRGKRMKYTFSDEETDFMTDSTGNRRSMRNTRNHSPAEGVVAAASALPVTTASGRQVRAPSRLNETALSTGLNSAVGSAVGDAAPRDEDVEMADGDGDGDGDGNTAAQGRRGGRPKRSAAVHHGTTGWAPAGAKKRNKDDMDSEEEDDQDFSEPEFGDDEDEQGPDDYKDEEDDEYDEEAEIDGDVMEDDDEDIAVTAATAAGTTTTTTTTAPGIGPGSGYGQGSGNGLNSGGGINSAGARPKKARWSLMCVFRIRVTLDQDGKVKKLPTSKPSPKIHKRVRAAHRRVIVSSDTDSAPDASSFHDDDDDNDNDKVDDKVKDEDATEEAAESSSASEKKKAVKQAGEVITFAAHPTPPKAGATVAKTPFGAGHAGAASALAAGGRSDTTPAGGVATPASAVFKVGGSNTSSAKGDGPDNTSSKTPLTPSSNGHGPGTSLAFRESLEKQPQQRDIVQPPTIGVGSD